MTAGCVPDDLLLLIGKFVKRADVIVQELRETPNQ
jgi:hypothetical protein